MKTTKMLFSIYLTICILNECAYCTVSSKDKSTKTNELSKAIKDCSSQTVELEDFHIQAEAFSTGYEVNKYMDTNNKSLTKNCI